jgi:lipoprotein-releasing system permease protein
MSTKKWIGYVAARYFKSNRSRNSDRDRDSSGKMGAAPVLSVAGIATGVLALTVILAVMNGFQMGFIESIIEISSYHVRARVELEDAPLVTTDIGADSTSDSTSDTAALRSGRRLGLLGQVQSVASGEPFVKAAVPFAELQGIVRGPYPQTQQVVAVRALPPDALERDHKMAGRLVFESGSFNLHDPQSILLGAEAAARLSVEVGDSVSFLSLAGLIPQAETTVDTTFIVRGVFRSDFYEYDLGWAFINLGRAMEMEDDLRIMLGIKINDRFGDQRAIAALSSRVAEVLGTSGTTADVTKGGDQASLPYKIEFSSWRDYNKAFFGALRTEKLFMFILVGLIFIVAGIQIYQSQRRLVLERSEEIGLLRAIGAEVVDIRLVFALNGVIIGGAGAGAGVILSCIIALNISPIFRALENAANFVLGLFHEAGAFSVFSPAVFYLKDIPARLIPGEVALIFLFGFMSAVVAGWFASSRAARISPAEVLRYE